jgi:hypothetical protein
MTLHIESPASLPPAPQRRAILRIAPEIFVSVLKELATGRRISVKGLPADAEVTAARVDETTGLIMLRLASAEFKEVVAAEIAPDLDVVFTVEKELEPVRA